MKDWKKFLFREVVHFPPEIKLDKGKQYPYIELADINIGFKNVYSVNQKVYEGSGSRFTNGDTLFARITPSLENGKIAQVKDLQSVGFGSGEFFVFRGKANVTDNDFIYYLSQTKSFKDHAINSMVGASGRQRADHKFVGKTEIYIPALSTQKKIAKILSNFDDLIDNNLKRIKLLEEVLKLKYEEWFLRFKINDQKQEINSETKIPIGWKKVLLTEFIELVRGVEPGSNVYENFETEKNIPFIRVGDLSKRESNIFISRELAGSKLINKEDILLSLDGSPGMVKFGLEGSYSSGIRKAVSKNKNISNVFIFNLLNSPPIQGLIKTYASGTTILHAGSSVKKMEIILPTDRILDNYNDVEMRKFQLILNLIKKNQLLKKARDILLPRLMTGIINVDNLDAAV